MIVTLCGSTKFKQEFMDWAQAFTMMGYIVLMPGVFGHSDGVILTEDEKSALDLLHKRKIAMSDEIFIVNKNGYIGDSTKSEIDFATALNIPVKYMEE